MNLGPVEFGRNIPRRLGNHGLPEACAPHIHRATRPKVGDRNPTDGSFVEVVDRGQGADGVEDPDRDAWVDVCSLCF